MLCLFSGVIFLDHGRNYLSFLYITVNKLKIKILCLPMTISKRLSIGSAFITQGKTTFKFNDYLLITIKSFRELILWISSELTCSSFLDLLSLILFVEAVQNYQNEGNFIIKITNREALSV